MCLELRPDVAFAASRRLWLCVGTYHMLRRDVILWESITIIPPFARYIIYYLIINSEKKKPIEYIHGDLTELTPALAVVETAGVGYALNISLNTYTAIQGKQEVKLYVHEVLTSGGRDDSFTLFGFATKQERELYRLLITVSGVGGNTARMILSSLSPRELCEIISTGNDKVLKTVKGIGLKTAQRIIIDLKDKIVSLGIADELPASGGNVVMVNNDVKDEAVSALTMLGFSPAPSAKVVVDILKAQPDLPVEQVVKLALKQIK